MFMDFPFLSLRYNLENCLLCKAVGLSCGGGVSDVHFWRRNESAGRFTLLPSLHMAFSARHERKMAINSGTAGESY